MEKRDLFTNPTSCPQGLGIRGTLELSWSFAPVQRGDGERGDVLLLSTSCGSCRGWLMTIQAPNGKENGKGFPAYKFCLSLPTQETGRQALRWHRAHLPRMREQWETGGRKRPGAEPQWLLSQSVLPSCHSQEGAGTTGFPHGDPTLARQIKHS